MSLKNIIVTATAIISLSVLCSCGHDIKDESASASVPQLLSCTPENGSADILGSTVEVEFVFDRNVICPSSLHDKMTVDNEAAVDKVFAYRNTITVTISGLNPGTSYALTIPSGVVSGYENNPVETIVYRFSTKSVEGDWPREPSGQLTNPAATAGAVKLYKFLVTNYGTKTISGAMGGTAWETTYTDYIYEKAGKYPGITGFDYLFLNWPAKYWDGCPDYDDITPVKQAWDAGSIIQICWHWTVPSKEGETDIDNYSYDTRAFGVKNALKEGTWQNKVIDSQIEKLAGHMKLLQEAGIPVIFRPLHESAGDYRWGPWFWWGYDGSSACKELWIYLRDKLQNTYGLNNLIWLWTVQTSYEGRQAEDIELAREWYPGDEYVDMVGADLYVEKGSSQAAAFRYVNNSVRGKKMVVLSEFGNLLDIDRFFQEDAPWGYFMNWSNYEDGSPVLWAKNQDGTYLWNNTAEDWKKALYNSRTLNRGDMDSVKQILL